MEALGVFQLLTYGVRSLRFTHNQITYLTKLLVLFLVIAPLFEKDAVLAEENFLGQEKAFFRIDEVKVLGNRKVEVEAILEKIISKPGVVLSNYLLKKDLEKIYSLKYFDEVEAHKEVRGGKNVLLFKVLERPTIASVKFRGNDELSNDDLQEKIGSKSFSILDVNLIKKDVNELKKLYEEKGFFLATVDHEIQKKENNAVDIIFQIKEFDKLKIKKITVLGNNAFTDKQLKELMQTREDSVFSFLSDAGNFQEFNFQGDLERLKYFYKTKGFLQINVGTPELTISEDKKWLFITFKVNEGPKFEVNEVNYRGDLLFASSELKKVVKLEKGAIYSEDTLRKDIMALTEKYQDEGYAFTNVSRVLRVVPGENKVNVDFSFEKGQKSQFGRIIIKGNSRTRDKVIRRELLIKEGAQFSGSDLRKSRENVNRLGYFEKGSVVFTTVAVKGRDNLLNVEISVKERNTGQMSVGAGYSSAQGGFFQGSISQNNFLGRGQNLNFSLSVAKNKTDFNLSFTEPYLLDTKWTAGGDLFHSENRMSESYSFKKKGLGLRVGYPIFDYTRAFVNYKWEETRITDSVDKTLDTGLDNGVASSISGTVVRDKRNNAFEPTGGYYAKVTTEWAGLGGDKHWWRNELDARYFKRLIGELVLRTRYFLGTIEALEENKDKGLPRTEKYYLGGSRNLRGYSFQAVGPKKSVEGQPDVNEGGTFSTFGIFELEHPLVREAGLKWVVFFDVGHAGGPDNIILKKDYGFGFRWFSPIGILRFEFGYPLNPSSTDASNQFHFDIGQLF